MTHLIHPAVASLAFLALAARAQPSLADDGAFETLLRESLAVSPAPSRDDVTATGLSLALDLRHGGADGPFFSAGFGVALAAIDAPGFGDAVGLSPSNLMLGGGVELRSGDLALRLGASVGAPLAIFWQDALAPKKAAEYSVLAAAASRGFRAPWRWQMNTVPLVGLLELDVPLATDLTLGVVLEPAWLQSVNARPSRAALRAAVTIAARWAMASLSAGASTWLSGLSLENGDGDQTSLFASVGVDFSRRLRLSLEGHVNIDGPYGVASGRAGPTWGLALALEHRL